MLKLSTHKFQCLMCEDNWKDLSIKKFLVHVFAKYKVFAETTANSLSPALSLIFPYKCCAWQWWLFRFSVQRFLSSCYGGRGRSAIVFSHSPPPHFPLLLSVFKWKTYGDYWYLPIYLNTWLTYWGKYKACCSTYCYDQIMLGFHPV